MYKTIAIGSDKGGFPLKESVRQYLTDKGYEVHDVGTLDPDQPVLFYQTATNVAEEIRSGKAEMGVLCCNTGMGMAQVANKYSGIFAAVCESPYTAQKAREVNDSNVLCMGTWVVTPAIAEEMTDVFLNTEFTQGLPEERAEYLSGLRNKVREIDSSNRKGR